MRIKIHRDVPDDVARWFAACFRVAVERLGIADYDRTLLLRVGWSPIGNDTEQGAFYPHLGELERIRAGKTVRRFVITLVPKRSLERMLRTFCHELIHLRQYITGEIGATFSRGRPVQQYFKQEARLPYCERPWEKEAHEKMHQLAEYVLSKVGPPPPA